MILQDAVGAERVERPVLQEKVDLPAHRRRAHREDRGRLQPVVGPREQHQGHRSFLGHRSHLLTTPYRSCSSMRGKAGRAGGHPASHRRALRRRRSLRSRGTPGTKGGHGASKDRAEDGAAPRDGRAPRRVLLGGVLPSSQPRGSSRAWWSATPARTITEPPWRTLASASIAKRSPAGDRSSRTPPAVGDHDDERRRAVHDPGAPRGKVVRARAGSGRGGNVGALRSRNRSRRHAGGLHGLPDPPVDVSQLQPSQTRARSIDDPGAARAASSA